MYILSRFGIEFAPEVVRADGTVRNLAWRICNAKRVLVSIVPFLFFQGEGLIGYVCNRLLIA